MRKTRSTGTRRRRRWTAIALAVGVPALAVPSLVLTRDGAEPVQVDPAAYYQLVSVRDGSALDVAGADDADGARIRQEKRATGAASRQWRLRPVHGGFWQLVNHGSGKVPAVRGSATADDRGGADQRRSLAKADTAARPSAVAAPAANPSPTTSVAPSGSHTWRSAQLGGGASSSILGSVRGAQALGFGKAAPGASYPAMYLVNDDRHQYVTGDPDVYGRVHVGTNGRGVLYAEPS